MPSPNLKYLESGLEQFHELNPLSIVRCLYPISAVYTISISQLRLDF